MTYYIFDNTNNVYLFLEIALRWMYNFTEVNISSLLGALCKFSNCNMLMLFRLNKFPLNRRMPNSTVLPFIKRKYYTENQKKGSAKRSGIKPELIFENIGVAEYISYQLKEIKNYYTLRGKWFLYTVAGICFFSGKKVDFYYTMIIFFCL